MIAPPLAKPIPPLRRWRPALVLMSFCSLLSSSALAHGVAQGDNGYLKEIDGVHIIPFISLGAKHMR